MNARHEPPNRSVSEFPRRSIPIGGGREARNGCEVTAPIRLLRTWRLLTAVNEQLHADAADEAAAHRAATMFNVLRDEVLRSVSPPLAEEVRKLLPPLDEHSGVAGTRTACAAALAWLDGLMTSVLPHLAEGNGNPPTQPPGGG
ncbi:hypothetical protein [Actinomadura decatromicini]|uniref:Bacterial proteasome activator n=1 Tax=Actinomadura decatromicini TaxID=2604572 RepID=A0A5D3F3L5_9ACTN|nr:hypothetical protein [Actinomadura decatromicini]TYK43607.1 hypothetical protein FXF68_36220 [Actinomadura decatromicini]